ncbi:MAG: CHAT domain-containing tetratricopeptide repeat protein [Acidobacteriota bacterium]
MPVLRLAFALCWLAGAWGVSAIEPPEATEIQRLLDDASYREAAERARQLAAELERGEAESTELAKALSLLAEALCHGGKAGTEEAATAARRALELRQRALGPGHPDVAQSLHTSACLSWAEGDYERAGELLEQALEIRRSALGERTIEVARTFNDLGLLRKMQGDYAVARGLYEDARALREVVACPVQEKVSGDTNHAVLLREIGDLEGARELLEHAVATAEGAFAPDHPRLASSLNSLARLHQRMGDYASARSLFERVLKMRQAAFGPDHPAVGISLNNLGLLLQEMGAYRDAGELFERAQGIWRRTLPAEHPHVVTGLNNQAGLLHRQGELAAARGLYERALAIRQRIHDPEHPQVALALHNLAGLLTESGEHAAARSRYERALEILAATHGPDHPAVARSLEKLAVLLRAEGDSGAALELFERGLEIRRSTFGEEHPNTVAVRAELAATRWRRGDLEGALAAALIAEAAGLEHARLTFRTLPEHLASSFSAHRPAGLDTVLSVASASGRGEVVRQAWDAVIRSRALVLDEMSARRRVVRTEPSLEPIQRELFAARQRLANLYVRSSTRMPPTTRHQLTAEARREKERWEAELAQRSDRFRSRQRVAGAGFDEVSAALPKGAALVAYARFERTWSASETVESSYLAFVGSPQGDTRVFDLGSARELDRHVEAWRDQLQRYSERRYRRAGAALRRAIWDPLSASLEGAERVFVVPAGELHRVSFAALPVGETEYLVEHGPTLHYLSAERDLLIESASAGEGLLILGAADFDASPGASREGSAAPSLAGRPSSGCETVSALPFASLAASAEEVQQLAQLWSHQQAAEESARLLIGAAATESAFKQHAAGRRVLHLATHGYFLGDPSVEPSASTERGNADSASVDLASADAASTRHPLLRSGLALAGANRCAEGPARADDGILTAEEIAALDLSAARLVVLSACETGSGTRSAGGVFGLRRAFRTAGARTLVMSLWRVEDRSTQRWMEAFYDAWLKERQPIDRAVRSASLELLQGLRSRGETTHPAAWAAFLAEGDWR